MFNITTSGCWWITSKKDPRWNAQGTSDVGGFGMCTEAERALERLKKLYGKPPKDLEHGYMKD